MFLVGDVRMCAPAAGGRVVLVEQGALFDVDLVGVVVVDPFAVVDGLLVLADEA